LPEIPAGSGGRGVRIGKEEEDSVNPEGALQVSTRVASAGLILAIAPICGLAQGANPCTRFPVGSSISAPQDLFSENGVLQVNLTYQTMVDQSGNALFCFVTEDGSESPTLHVHPGDRLLINLTNNVPSAASSTAMAAIPGMAISRTASSVCGAATMTASAVNIHYHGTNTPPICHQDEVIHTLINSGETFRYDVQFPADEPPGLYWYHPHVHGIAEAAVQGGASGALIVEGIQDVNPEVAGLPQQVLIIRDNPVPGNPTPGGSIPSWDISLNYTPVPYPAFTPAIIRLKPSEKQFWRVLNASADTIIDLQLQYDGRPQPLRVVALDGVPTGSQDGSSRGKSFTESDILLAPAARAEFIVTGPAASVRNATLLTLNVDTGPDGDNDPTRPMATVKASDNASEPLLKVPYASEPPPKQRFAGLAQERPTAERKLYFSEVASDPSNPDSPTNFYITVDGQTPTLFNPDNPPAIVTTQGSIEDWTIENRSMEHHEFHIHQVHFLLLEQDGVPVKNGPYLDMIQVPYWSGSGPYPCVKVRLDFRGSLIGDFVYHCHILGHEDNGMMAIIRVEAAHRIR
jgi:FtsP/CotA-like multicopper oxidase with cupredoxin domain